MSALCVDRREQRIVWSTERSAERSTERSTEARGGGGEGDEKKTNILSKIKNKSGHSVFYIYRIVQKFKWLCSVIC